MVNCMLHVLHTAWCYMAVVEEQHYILRQPGHVMPFDWIHFRTRQHTLSHSTFVPTRATIFCCVHSCPSVGSGRAKGWVYIFPWVVRNQAQQTCLFSCSIRPNLNNRLKLPANKVLRVWCSVTLGCVCVGFNNAVMFYVLLFCSYCLQSFSDVLFI